MSPKRGIGRKTITRCCYNGGVPTYSGEGLNSNVSGTAKFVVIANKEMGGGGGGGASDLRKQGLKKKDPNAVLCSQGQECDEGGGLWEKGWRVIVS